MSQVFHPTSSHTYTRMSSISIREAQDDEDANFVIACFDTAQLWLSSIGSDAQWGIEPFSKKTEFCRSVRNYVEQPPNLRDGMTWIADIKIGGKNIPAGAMVLSTNPPSYTLPQSTAVPVPEIYIRILITDRNLGDVSKGVGSKLLDFARMTARQKGIGLLRVDCWKGGDDALVR